MKDAGSGMGVKNIFDLVSKEIYDICETKSPTKEQISEYKMIAREIYEKFDNFKRRRIKYKK